MRILAIGFLVLVAAYVLYRFVAHRDGRVREAQTLYFRTAGELDITRGEAEQFLDFLVSQSSDSKRTKEFFETATHELKRRVTIPRSRSRDRRPIETIAPLRADSPKPIQRRILKHRN